MAVALYLTVLHYRGVAPVCLSNGCEIVQRSRYAELAGIPVAALGAATFLCLLTSASLRAKAVVAAAAATALAAVLFAAYLVYVQFAVLHAVCMWCIASDALLLVAAGAAIVRLRQSLQ